MVIGVKKIEAKEDSILKDNVTIDIFKPSEEQVTTIYHSLNTLNQIEIMHIIESFGIKIDRKKIRKKDELIQYLVYKFKEGSFSENLFNELRSQAFNPEIDSTDGFFFSFEAEITKVTRTALETFLKGWNELNPDKEIKLSSLNGQIATLLVTKHTEKLIFDQESMFSIKYNDEKRALSEIHFDKNLIYIQTTNIVIYSTIRTIIREFLQGLLNVKKVPISPPKMSRNLSITFNEEFTKAKKENTVHPNTIRLLDLLLELDSSGSSFSGFECVNVTLDHEDTIKRKDAKSKIISQNYGGGDLLKNSVVKDLILSNRIIYEIEFSIEYNYVDGDGNPRNHIVIVGITNDRKSSLRIFIKNSDYNLRSVIKKAYGELTSVFISNYGLSNLRNEENIKKLLGIK